MIVIFDIDGTLCHTSGVDDSCWCRAAEEILGVGSMSTDWGVYPHSTDESIACALIREHLKEEPTRELLDRLRDRFLELLEETRASDPDQFQSTPGAAELIEALKERGIHVAVATGGWRCSACLKLECAGIPTHDLPAAFADDAHPRERIITIAMERAAARLEIEPESLGNAVYVGDGCWDVRAARALDIGFLGVATGNRAAMLREEGATRVFPDFTDQKAFFEALTAF